LTDQLTELLVKDSVGFYVDHVLIFGCAILAHKPVLHRAVILTEKLERVPKKAGWKRI
jgi:hypothetical protein